MRIHMNIKIHIISYHIISYHIISYQIHKSCAGKSAWGTSPSPVCPNDRFPSFSKKCWAGTAWHAGAPSATQENDCNDQVHQGSLDPQPPESWLDTAAGCRCSCRRCELCLLLNVIGKIDVGVLNQSRKNP